MSLLSDAAWSPAGDWLAFNSGAKDVTGGAANVYLPAENRLTCLARNVVRGPAWSPDGRYLTLLQYTPALRNLTGRVPSDSGKLTVLDARRDFRAVLNSDIVTVFLFSPDGAKVAYTERVKDGDAYQRYALRVADLATGRIRDISIGSRRPRYAWAWGDTLAVTTFDKYAVPTLSLVDTQTGRAAKLVTDREANLLVAGHFVPSGKLVAYTVSRTRDEMESPQELWTVIPGRTPVRVFPRNVRSKP